MSVQLKCLKRSNYMQVRLTQTLTFTLALCGVYEEELSLISDYRLVAVKLL